MSVAAVVFNGTRLNSSDANTGWGNFNTGGGAPASEPANAYQQDTPGSTVGAVGKKINSTTQRQGVDYNGTSVDYATNGYLWYTKVYVADGFNVNVDWGVEVGIGSGDTSPSHRYNIAGLSANNDAYLTYPPQGGYIITAIDPTIDGWAETADSGGTTDQTALTWYAVGAQFITGEAKSENVAMDAIDYGTGLTVTGGGNGEEAANFIDFVEEDQADKSNRWGVVTGQGDTVNARGILTIGTTLSTDFNDTTSIVNFLDGYHSDGKVGVYVGLSSTDTTAIIDSLMIGAGRDYTGIADTRPDFIVGGTQGGLSAGPTLRNFRNMEVNSAVQVAEADIECVQLTQLSAHIFDTVIRTRSTTGVATVPDPTFGTTTDMHDVEFVREGDGHALEIALSGTYDFTNMFFTDYGDTGTLSAALDVSATTGDVTINVNGGDTPTYNTAGATVTVNNTVTVTVVVQDVEGNLLSGARVLMEADAGGDLAEGTDIVTGLTNVSGQAVNAGFNYTNPQPVKGWVRKSTDAPYYKQGIIAGTIQSTGLTTTILMISDE